MTCIEAIPQSQKEDLIELIYTMTLEEKEETKKESATSAKTRSAQ